MICGARPQPAALMREAGFDRHVPPENICESITDALKRAEEIFRELRITSPAQAPMR
jgi:hypothetical protein